DPARALVVEQLLRDLPAVEPGHHHVEQDHVGQLGPSDVEPGRPIRRFEHLHALGLEVDATEQPDRRFVVDHEYASLTVPIHTHLRHALCATGSTKVNLDPLPSSERTQILPPIADTRPCAMKSPSPVPGCVSVER